MECEWSGLAIAKLISGIWAGIGRSKGTAILGFFLDFLDGLKIFLRYGLIYTYLPIANTNELFKNNSTESYPY